MTRTCQISDFIMTQIPVDKFNLAVGQPSQDLIPIQKLHEAIQSTLTSISDPLIYQYASVEGAMSMRRDLARFLIDSGRYPKSLHPCDLLMTYGNSYGLSVAIKALTRPGDNVLVEDPTYFLCAKLFSECHVKIHGCSVSSGLDMTEFESLARTLKPSLVYVNPVHHNPTGTCMQVSSRARLIQLSQELNFYILSDEPYVLLSFNETVEESETSLATTAERIMPPSYKQLVCLGSFSKIMAPGLRCGWMSGHEDVLKVIAESGALVSGGGPPPVLVEAIRNMITSGQLEQHIDFLCRQLELRKNSLVDSLKAQFNDDVLFHTPSGGYFVYVYFPSLNTAQFQECISDRLSFLPGVLCSAVNTTSSDSLESSARLAFSFYSPSELQEAVAVMRTCFKMFS